MSPTFPTKQGKSEKIRICCHSLKETPVCCQWWMKEFCPPSSELFSILLDVLVYLYSCPKLCFGFLCEDPISDKSKNGRKININKKTPPYHDIWYGTLGPQIVPFNIMCTTLHIIYIPTSASLTVKFSHSTHT